MSAFIQKLLLEDDFLTEVLINNQDIILQYKDLLPEQANQISETKEKIVNFFGGKHVFDQKMQSDTTFKKQVLDYSKEKFTYLLASERSGELQAVVWVLG